MVQTDSNDHAQVKAKLVKNSDGHQGPNGKKQRPSRHVRQRARLPTEGPDKAKYDLPHWVGDDSFKTMMMMILKSLANTQQRLRVVESVVADNFLVPSDIAPVAAGITQAEAYHKKAISSSGTNMGPPAPQVLYAFCDSLVKCDIGAVPKADIEEHILARIKMSTPDNASAVVAMFSIKPCYDPSSHKVVIVSQEPEARDALVRGLKAIPDVKHFTAPAPASGQEDEIQKWIEKLETME